MMTNASLVRRIGAIVYDSMLLLALMFFATLPFVAMRGGEPVTSGMTAVDQSTVIFPNESAYKSSVYARNRCVRVRVADGTCTQPDQPAQVY